MSEKIGSSARRRAAVTVLGTGVVVLLLAAPVLAQAERSLLDGKVRAGGEIVVPADETIPGNLYLSGGTIRVEGEVEGDLVATGGQIEVSGAIGGDALLAGGDVAISGEVADSTRAAGGRVLFSGRTGQDAAFAAGQVSITGDASVGQDLLFAAGQVRQAGTVEGSVVGGTGSYEETGVVAGTTEVAIPEPEEPPTAAQRLLDRIQRWLGLIVVGAIALWLAPRTTRTGAADLRRRTLAALGVGALGMIAALGAVVAVMIVAALLTGLFSLLGLGGLAGLSVTGGLLTSAIVSFLVVAVSAFLAPVLVGLWLGQYAVRDGGGWAAAFAATTLGTLAVVALASVPVLGALVSILVAVLGLGALVLTAWQRGRAPSEPPPPGEPAHPRL